MHTNRPHIAVIGLKGLPAYGGAAAVGENIIGQLKAQYDFTVLSVRSHTSAGTSNIDGIRQVVFRNFGKGGLNTFLYYWQCLFYVLFRDFDLIHLHHAESGFITPFLRFKYKVVVTFHGVYKYNDPKFSNFHNWFFRFSERLNVRFANLVISVSKPDLSYIENKYGRIIECIPNGIDLDVAQNLTDDQNKKKEYILFAAARIYEIKGLHLLLSSLKKINSQIEIKIAGDIDQVPEYKKQILALCDGMNVTFLGMIKDKKVLMSLVQSAKIFVFPSLTEAMSMMLLEVVSMKTPVIASDIPSNKAVFNDNEMLFFKSESVEDLKLKLSYALDKNDDMEKKATRAFEKLKNEYSWEKIAKQYSNIYSSLLN